VFVQPGQRAAVGIMAGFVGSVELGGWNIGITSEPEPLQR